MVRLLLADSRVSVNQADWVRAPSIRLVCVLLMMMRCGQSGVTAIYVASLNGHVDVVEVLLADSRLDANTVTAVGSFPSLDKVQDKQLTALL